MSNTRTKQRLPILDGLRGLAILSVLIYHQLIIKGETSLSISWQRIAECGWLGVDLFFVLSGYLITGILWNTKTKPHYFRNFYMRRVLRIFPLYYLYLIIVFIILPPLFSSLVPELKEVHKTAWWHVFYVSNILIMMKQWGYGIFNVLWTLSIEEQFYIFWPLIVFLLPRKKLIQFCVASVITTILLRVSLIGFDVHRVLIYVFTLCRIDSLLLGALTALLLDGSPPLKEHILKIRLVWALSLFANVGILCFSSSQYSFLMQSVGYTMMAITFATSLALLFTVSKEGYLSRALCNRLLTSFGFYSYGIYILHEGIRKGLWSLGFNPDKFLTLGNFWGQLSYYIVFSSTCLFGAYLSFHLFEKHFLGLKQYFTAKDSNPAESIRTTYSSPSVAKG